MPDFSIQVTGLDQMKAAFKNSPQTTRNIMNPVIHTAINILGKYTVKGVVPWKTGRLTQSFIASYGDLMGMWRPTVNYALYVHEGTGPHDIVPIKAQALFWPGAAHPVKRVHHPGTRPNPFMPRIIQNAQSDIDALLKKGLDQLVGAIASGNSS